MPVAMETAPSFPLPIFYFSYSRRYFFSQYLLHDCYWRQGWVGFSPLLDVFVFNPIVVLFSFLLSYSYSDTPSQSTSWRSLIHIAENHSCVEISYRISNYISGLLIQLDPCTQLYKIYLFFLLWGRLSCWAAQMVTNSAAVWSCRG